VAKPPSRPPADITAAAFFESWLADAYAASGRQAPDDAPVVRVTLSGEGGGEWEIEVAGDRLTVSPRDPGARGGELPGVWIRQKAADFLATFAGDPDLPELFPEKFGPLDLLFLDPQDVDLIKQIDGRLALELTGRRRRRWGLDLAAGKAGLAAGRPRATVKLDAATYDGLRDKSLPPLKALLERKIVVDGDRALAMQALLLLGARLARA
jgi:hypothetical protein